MRQLFSLLFLSTLSSTKIALITFKLSINFVMDKSAWKCNFDMTQQHRYYSTFHVITNKILTICQGEMV
jgi:hypothetical protein